MEWPDASYSVPGVSIERHFPLAFVSLKESRDKELRRQRCQFDATCFSEPDNRVVVIEANDLGDGSGLGCVVRDFVFLGRSHRFAACQPHERIAIGWCHVNPAFFWRPAEQFLNTITCPLRCKLSSTGKDPGDAGFRQNDSINLGVPNMHLMLWLAFNTVIA